MKNEEKKKSENTNVLLSFEPSKHYKQSLIIRIQLRLNWRLKYTMNSKQIHQYIIKIIVIMYS